MADLLLGGLHLGRPRFRSLTPSDAFRRLTARRWRRALANTQHNAARFAIPHSFAHFGCGGWPAHAVASARSGAAMRNAAAERRARGPAPRRSLAGELDGRR